jgi:hypothetical protein
MSLESKQHADLVRHREFNALRRLMAQRNPQSRLNLPDGAATQISRFESTHAISQIDALELQMSQQLMGTQQPGDFGRTRIAPLSEALATKPIRSLETGVVKDAAEHFANDRIFQAQTVLEQAIGERGLQHDHTPTWLALLDFCRATNQPDRFEAYSLDFSVRFGRSTPPWISLPHQAELASRERAPMTASLKGTSRADWIAPLFLTRIEIQALQVCIQEAHRTSRQLVMDWRDLVQVEAAQWGELQIVLESLASSSLHCTVHGAAMLEHVFDASTAQAMLANLALLRCQNQAQAFEDLAMDYCMKFEVSPPDWHLPLCRFESPDLPLDTSSAPLVESAPELYGVLEGNHAMSSINALAVATGLVIRCDRLVRCDAVATVALVRWAEAAKQLGRRVEFKNVHRLIESYFAAQGLTQHAKVTIRRD